MKTQTTLSRKFTLSLCGLFAVATFITACGDDETTNPTTTTTTTTTTGNGGSGGEGTGGQGGAPGTPMVPTLGSQIDRKGRPAINTATNNTFADDATRGAAEDAWNANDDAGTWGDFVPDIMATLAILDSLDGTCGNQVAYDALGNPNYATLATVFAHDWLIVKGDAAGGCNTYLGVEANVLGVVNDDCGGRMPSYDVIETTYSAAAGVGLSGFDDTITAPAQAMVTTFPYLADPN